MTSPSAYHDRLPYGERVPADPVLGGPLFPFDGDVQMVPLADPVIPEPPRAWFLARRDAFASRFLIAAALGVQVIAWVAVVRYLW
jgi:hypothetical protein